MYTYAEKGNIVHVRVESYNGDIAEHGVVKETGLKVRAGGTASNQINIFAATLLSTPFIDERSGVSYCDVCVRKQTITLPVCGKLSGDKRVFVIETLDLDEKTRWIVMEDVPTDARRHFINIDIVDGEDKVIRRLRVDPFYGGAKVI
jgi:hypothetical protein